MTRRISVDIPQGAYEVVIGCGLMAEAGSYIAPLVRGRKAAVISDSNVVDTFGARVDASLARVGFDVTPMMIPAGETSKNWDLAGHLLEAMADSSLGREDVVVAFGGGVVGDLAGFTAGVYLRGVAFAQVPTTLLAMVDSSVGGKTGVDLRAGKNLAGAFKQPLVVVADIDVLASLPEAQWQSGLAEVAKSAVIEGADFLGWLESHSRGAVTRDASVTEEMVARCVAFKAAIVSSDEREEGPRESLNYGHTLGHALEKVAGYGHYTHGHAVAEGMRFAARIAVEVAGADAEFVRRQDRLLDGLGLPATTDAFDPKALLDAMHADKKARGGSVRMVLADAPGRWACVPVSDDVIHAHLEAWASTKEGSGA